LKFDVILRPYGQLGFWSLTQSITSQASQNNSIEFTVCATSIPNKYKYLE